MAYEQAQLAQVRLQQQHTSEAMLHSFRAIEGGIWEWMINHCGDYIQHPPKRYPQLLRAICDRHPSLQPIFIDRTTQEPRASFNLNGHVQQQLLEAAMPNLVHHRDMQAFWSQENRDQRNALSHRLGGLTTRDVFIAWGAEIRTIDDWQQRIVNCLNVITAQSFKSLNEASLFSSLHGQIEQLINTYEP